MNGGRMTDAQRLEDAERLRAQVLGTRDLSMDEETEGGTIKISENVIAAVVRKYTLEVDGVVRFASSMVIDLDEDTVNISVTLVFRFGVRIPDVAQAVQEVVRLRVEELTGKHVSRVNVLVHDLEDVVPSRKGDDLGGR
jgi:uncharacterized alkaline shock family protein YloU